MPTRIITSLPCTELPVAGPFDGHNGNFDESRVYIDRIVLHTMVGTWEGTASRFNDPSSNVSAHYGVKLDGGLIHWLEETFTAYHAGDYAMNQRSIGIEHEDGGDYNGVRPDVLYEESAKLVADICKFYSIPCDRDHIKKHSEVSDQPTACPDALDIDKIVSMANNLLTTPVMEMPQYLLELFQAQGLDPNNESATRAFWQQAIDFPTCNTDKINAQTQLATANNVISDLTGKNKKLFDQNTQLTIANNQQANMISSLQKDLQNCQQNPVNLKGLSFWQKFNLLFS